MVPGTRSRSVFTLATILVTVAALSIDTHSATDPAGVPVAAAGVAATGTLVLSPEDTSLNINATNYSTDTVLTTYTWPAFKVANAAVMKFDLSALPAGAVVTDAALHLALVQFDGTADASYTVSAHKVLGKNPVISMATGYTFDGLTNWTAAACCSVPLAQADISASYDQKSIDKTPGDKSWAITTMVQEWLAQPSTNFGLLLNSDASKAADRFRFFASMEHTDTTLRPYLTVTYSATGASSIALSATSVAASGNVTATIANGPGNAGDWVGLFAAGAADGTYIDWKYLNGAQVRPGTGVPGAAVAFTMPAVLGTYNVRFFLNDSLSKLATSPTITVTAAAPPGIALSATTVALGGTVTATINGPGNAGDWVGLFSAGAADGTYVDWKYLNGTKTRPASGMTGAAVAFTMPTVQGTYNVRLFLDDSITKLATSATITVTGGTPPGIALSATTVATGGTVTATMANGPGNAGDWVGLFSASAADGTYWDWKYLNGTRTRPGSGVTGAAVAFTMPAAPGTYNLRFFLNDSLTKLATSATITATATVTTSIALSATTVAPGAAVTATIANGPSTAGDWVGLFATAAPNSTYLDWKYLNGTQTRPASGVSGAAVPFTMPATPGTYNVRFFLNDSLSLLATSPTITVQTSDGTSPSVSITAPAAAATVAGTVVVTANASDNVGVVGVQFKLDGTNLGAEDTTTPYSVSWNTTTGPNGSHMLTAVARDAAGNVTTSAAVSATVANDTTLPSVSITGPAAGATVSGVVTVGATAADNVGVVGVQFTLDGANLGIEDTTSPFSQSWTTSTSTNASHTLTAVARDAAGNTKTSASVTVTVLNDAVPPAVSITAPTGGSTMSGTITVAASASDNLAVAGVQFKLDGANLGTEDTTASYSQSWTTTTATNGSHTLTAVARDAAGNQTISSAVTVTVSNSSAGAGIAALYPGDIGIENDPNVIFVERFDEANLTALFSRWTDILGGSTMSFSTDVPSLSPLPRSLNIPWTGGGVSSGGHLYKVLSPGVDDTFYLRYYIKYPTTGKYMHHGIWTGGYNPPLNYPSPRAGTKPVGNDLFSAAAEQDDLTLRMDHYNYWMNMHLSNDGNYWGNLLLNDPDVFGKAGQWMCVEQMVKLNTPVTSSNGEHAIWVDGAKVSHLGAGFPNGSWSGGIFTQNPAGTPFTGLRWRSDANLNVNYIWLQTYAPNDPAGFSANMKFAHVVAARSYIGCLTPSAPDTTQPSVSMTAPAGGTTVSGATTVSANASDNQGVVGVQFKLDGVNLGPEDMAPSYSTTWNASTASSGAHTLTAVARDSAGNTRTAASVTVTVSNPTGSAWPNEPSGLVAMTDQPWNALIGGGWNRRSGGTDQIVSDSTAPLSPSNIMEYVYPVGFVDGWAPATQYYPVNGKELFVGMWWKPSSPWQGNNSNVNKIQFLQVQNSSVYMTMYGSNGGSYELRTNAQWSEMGSQWLTPNVNNGVVTLGQWHRLEWYLKYDSSYGAGNGIIRWWLDGVLVGDYTNVRFPNDGGFVEYQISPTWGGNTGQAKTQRDTYRFDHSYISKR